MTFKFRHYNSDLTGYFQLGQYEDLCSDGKTRRLAVQIIAHDGDGQWAPYAVVSVNTDYEPSPGEIVAKTYMENAGLVEQLIQAGFFEETGSRVLVGHAGLQPVLRITLKLLEHRDSEEEESGEIEEK
jgi:hypothetical protein